MGRSFRTDDSTHSELITRDAVIPFLESRGFQGILEFRRIAGTAITQIIEASTPDGQAVKIRVRLCWRRVTTDDLKYSAAQLRARLINEDWGATLEKIMRRDQEQQVTHNLLLQRDGALIVYAALIPSHDLKGIFDTQAEVSQELIESGQMGRRKKNHAKNGSSPTLYLMDERTPAAHRVADVLWNWPGVIDLMKLPQKAPTPNSHDAMDDCPLPEDYSMLGTDTPLQRTVLRAEYPRDPKVRVEVLKRASRCERSGCNDYRAYKGFLDVHHILGIKMGDRVWNCVALCPNCHRDAHFSPEADSINFELLKYAERFGPI
ncbi:HNH endonuclease [Pseudomonas aeruginosa]|nr:HNH endonuclease [Pseudomonas aeruginosa]